MIMAQDRSLSDLTPANSSCAQPFEQGLRAALAAAFVALTLAGCAESPSRPAAGSGGYYLDDGPGPTPPANLDAIAEPVPRIETVNPYTSRPYTVLGRRYAPLSPDQARNYKQRGIASWYGKRYHGQKTSSGEVYDMYAMSAAHTVLPLPSFARVTNLDNGKSVVVRVNDRGPFHDNRLIDLSYAAAHRIGIIGKGSALVEVETLVPGADSGATTTGATAKPAVPDSAREGGMFVQLGAFSQVDNADAFIARLLREHNWLSNSLRLVQGVNVHKVQTGPYATLDEAMAIVERAKEAGMEAFVVNP